jgi:type II secretory pathway component PulM
MHVYSGKRTRERFMYIGLGGLLILILVLWLLGVI